MKENQYSPPILESGSYPQVGYHLSQEDKTVRYFKKLYREAKTTNTLLKIQIYILLTERTRGREDVFGNDWATMMRGLEPQKRKRKKHDSMALEGWWSR